MDNKYMMAEEQDFKIGFNTNGDIQIMYIGNNEGIEYIDITDIINKLKVKDLNYFLKSEPNNFKISGLKNDNNNIISTQYAFKNLKTKYLNLSEFNTDNVLNFSAMFYSSEINYIDFSNFNIESAFYFNFMFSHAKIDVLDISSFCFKKDLSIPYIFSSLECNLLILPHSFPIIFESITFIDSNIKVIKTPNKEFYEKNKKWFKEEFNTELILIS